MYIEQAKNYNEIQKVEEQMKQLEQAKYFGPDLIKKLEKEMTENPALIEECQFKINTITNMLVGYEATMKMLTSRLQMLLV